MPRMTDARAREIFFYDPVTGLLIWKKATSNKSKVGQVAGSMNITDGYFQVNVEKYVYRVHRLAWLYMTGKWPECVDHINRDRSDNRWSNLRSVSHAENMQNRMSPQVNSTTGFLGVSFDKSKKKYSAKISVNGKSVHIGMYECAELAYEKYLDAKRFHHQGCFFDEQGERDAAAMQGRVG